MEKILRENARLIAVAILAFLVLIALLAATGGGFPTPTTVPPTVAPAATPTTPVNSVQGVVTVSAKRLSGHTWRFRYSIRNTGSVPIAGFQINGEPANLFHVTSLPGWAFFGNGVCGQSHPHILIYWSINSASPQVIGPGKTASMGFDTNTSGSTGLTYSLSYGNAAPLFAKIDGPVPSTLPAPVPCGR